MHAQVTSGKARQDSEAGAVVLLVGDVLAPVDGAAGVVGFLHGDVGHEALGSGAVPVLLAGLEVDAIAGCDDLDGAAFALAEADALGDVDRLPEGVGVPGRARAGREVHRGGAKPGRPCRAGDGVDVDGAREPVAGAGTTTRATGSFRGPSWLQTRLLVPSSSV
jgi:hypothetical protein